MIDPSLTPLELERAVDALSRYRSLRRCPWEARQLASVVGRSNRPLRSTLIQLQSLGLLVLDDEGLWDVTQVGVQVLDARQAGDWSPLVDLVLRAGNLERDVLAFLGEAETRDNDAVLSRARARTICPTLAAIVGWHSDWRKGSVLAVPVEALQIAMSAAAIEVAEGRPDWVADRERVGHRAEAYSLRLERDLRGAGAVLHVSRDEGDGFGYDLEDVSGQPSRLIECKGSRSRRLKFVLSARELAVAREHAKRYEIHYWGGIDLGRPPEPEYQALREAGYPRVIRDPVARIDSGELSAECTAWTVIETST